MSNRLYHEFSDSNLPNLSTKKLLEGVGSLKEGHTATRNGHHTAGYLSKQGLLLHPTVLYELATRLARTAEGEYDFVVGPINFGYMLASYVALAANKPCSYLYMPHDKNGYTIERGSYHRDFVIPKGGRALLVDDWVVSGETIKASIEFLRTHGASSVDVAVIGANEKSAQYLKDIDATVLYTLPFIHYTPQDCPDCKANIPIKYQDIRE